MLRGNSNVTSHGFLKCIFSSGSERPVAMKTGDAGAAGGSAAVTAPMGGSSVVPDTGSRRPKTNASKSLAEAAVVNARPSLSVREYYLCRVPL